MTYELHLGDCLEVLRGMPADSIDSIVTDPPYGIRFMGKSWDGQDIENRAAYRASMPSHAGACGPNGGHRSIAAEAGKYDLTPAGMRAFQAFTLDWATECLRVLKPGGHLLSFAAARTYHHMAVGIEMAGFEIRDQIMWVFGSGFPKSHNLKGEHEGWGTALKPAHEPICMARKPFGGTVAANVAEHGTGAINIDACRIHGDDAKGGEYSQKRLAPGASVNADGVWKSSAQYVGILKAGRWPANLIHDGSPEVVAAFPDAPGQLADASTSDTLRGGQNTYGVMRRGRGSDLSANSENAGVVGFKMRPGERRLDTGSAARFFQKIEDNDQSWLFNLLPALDAECNLSLQELADAIARSDAAISALPEGIALSVVTATSTNVILNESKQIATAVIQAIPRFVSASLLGAPHDVLTLSHSPVNVVARREQIGTTTITASLSLSDGSAGSITFSITPRSSEVGEKDLRLRLNRLIYCAKTKPADRHEGLVHPGPQFKQGTTLRKVETTETKGNNHPTVKPTELMAYLLRLVTPVGGTALDPFMGSGSTGKAAMLEGFSFIGIEQDAAYMAIAKARIEHAQAKSQTQQAEQQLQEQQLSLFSA